MRSSRVMGWPAGPVVMSAKVSASRTGPSSTGEGGQLLDQSTLLGLEARSRVVRDQAGQSLLAMGTKEPRAVDRVEAEPVQGRGIANVMEERGRHQQVGILGRQDRCHAARLVSHCLDMRPTVRSVVLPAPSPMVAASWRDDTLRA
jgi:hypothetical protein